MTNFKHNFSKISLLAQQNIIFKDDEKRSFELIPMSVSNLYLNESLIWFLNFLDQDVEELQKFFPSVEITNHYKFMTLVLTLAEKKKELQELADLFLEALEVILPNIHFKQKVLFLGDISVNESLFNLIIDVIFMVLDRKPKIVINEDDDEMTKRMKQKQKKVEEIKRKGKKQNINTTSFEDMFAALLYEYPQYKLQDLFELNIYTFHFLFKYIGKIANYEVSKIAAGNGLAKKHKYFIEK